MKLYIKIMVIIFVTFLLSTFALAGSDIVDSMNFLGNNEEFNLVQVTDLALKDNMDIKMAKLDLEKAAIQSEKNKADAYALKKMQDRVGLNATTIVYPVLELLASFQIPNAERSVQTVTNVVKVGIEQTYNDLIQAEKMCQINKDNVDVSKKLLQIAQDKLNAGSASKLDVMNAEINLTKATNDYNAAEIVLKTAKMALNSKIARPLMLDIKLKDQLIPKLFILPSIASSINSAIDKRNELKAKAFALDTAKEYQKAYALLNTNSFDYRVKVIEVEKASRDLIDTKNLMEIEVRNNYMQLTQLKDVISTGLKSIELAREALRVSQVMYENGMGIGSDVQKAQVALLQARMGYCKNVIDYNLAITKFVDSIGVGKVKIPM